MIVYRWCPECEEKVELDDSEDVGYPIEEECCANCGETLIELPEETDGE